MEYEIRTPNGYVFLELSATGTVWKFVSGAGKRYAEPSAAIPEQDILRSRGYVCEIQPIIE